MKQPKNLIPFFRRYADKILRILVLLGYCIFVFLLWNQGPFAGYEIPRYCGTTGYLEEHWVYARGDTVLETDIELPAFRKMETDTVYSISTTLTYDGSLDQDPSCFFFVDHMYCRAFLDGVPLFSYTEQDVQKLDQAKSPGNVYVNFQLPPDCQGKEFRVEFLPALDLDIDYQLPTPSFGDFCTTAAHTYKAELPHNVIVILSAFLGIVAVLFSTLVLPRDKYREGLYIGIFATLFSLYNITESDFDFYIISNPYYTYLLDYTCFTLIPVFLMAFLRERVDPKQKPVVMTMVLMGIVMYVTEVTLHFLGILDMREFLPVLHVVYGLDFFIIFFMMLFRNKSPWKNPLILQMIPVLIGMVLDASVYYFHWQLSSSDSTFTAIGVIIFLMAELYHVWRYSVAVYTESIQSRNYREMAYVDALTGIGNRRAYDMEKKAIADGQRKFRTMFVASVDINNLKITNDTLGHAAGDFLIRSAANVLFDLCEDFGHAFRIGGDEFIVFLYDIDQTDFEARLEQMEAQITAINSNSETKLSLALGYELSRGGDLEAAIQKADKQMYINKARYKSGISQAAY